MDKTTEPSEIISEILKKNKWNMYKSSFEECKEIKISAYSAKTKMGCIEVIDPDGKPEIIEMLYLPDFAGKHPSVIYTALTRFDRYIGDICRMMALLPNITELELENFTNFDVFKTRKYTNIRKLTLVNCTALPKYSFTFCNLSELILENCNLGYIPGGIYYMSALHSITINNSNILPYFPPKIRTGLKHVFCMCGFEPADIFKHINVVLDANNVTVDELPDRMIISLN